MSRTFYKDDELIKNVNWHKSDRQFETDILVSCKVVSKTNYGIKLSLITILDRQTGFGWRDVETGYTSNEGQFWLASGDFDVRDFGDLTINQAIVKIKKNANNCVGLYKRQSFPINGNSNEQSGDKTT